MRLGGSSSGKDKEFRTKAGGARCIEACTPNPLRMQDDSVVPVWTFPPVKGRYGKSPQVARTKAQRSSL